MTLSKQIMNGIETPEGFVLGGQIDEAFVQIAAENGMKTIVNLRQESEMTWDERSVVEAAGMQYVAAPVGELADLDSTLLDQVTNLDPETTVIHCGSGNRVGALFAMDAVRRGVPAEDALALGKETGLTGWYALVAEELGT